MWGYVGRRLLLAIPTLWGATLIVFLLMRVAPGDVAIMMLVGEEGEMADVNPEALDKIRAELGLDKPIHIQYFVWMTDMLTGNFGDSYWFRRPAIELFIRRWPVSIQVAVMVMVISATVAIPFGILSALHQDRWPDYVLRSVAFTFNSVPSFWVGLVLILFFIRVFHWIPPQGRVMLWEEPLRNMSQMIWPALVLGLYTASTPLRMMRSTMLEVLREDFIRTARSKGLTERIVIVRHAMRNALIPVVTLYGLQIPLAVGGLVTTETVFGLPGIGLMLVEAIVNRDYPITQIIVAMVAVVIVTSNLIVDMVYGWLDPRIRY